jgi:hypothetical protein
MDYDLIILFVRLYRKTGICIPPLIPYNMPGFTVTKRFYECLIYHIQRRWNSQNAEIRPANLFYSTIIFPRRESYEVEVVRIDVSACPGRHGAIGMRRDSTNQ